MLTNEYLKRVYEGLEKRNANEPEFLQAVREVLESIQPVVEKHPEYEKAGLIERLVEPERIINVNAVLDELIDQSVAMVGKPVALMNKEDKVRAIRFLNQNGAFLVTKSGDKIAKYFGISKYTLYSYIDTKQQEGK